MHSWLPLARLRTLALAGAGVAVLALATGTDTPGVKGASPETIAKGRVTYSRYCVSCHGPEARGNGPLASDLRVSVPDLTRLAARSGGVYPYDRVVRIISRGDELRGHGTAEMPAWGPAFNRTDGIEGSVDEAIRNLARYLESVQRPR